MNDRVELRIPYTGMDAVYVALLKQYLQVENEVHRNQASVLNCSVAFFHQLMQIYGDHPTVKFYVGYGNSGYPHTFLDLHDDSVIDTRDTDVKMGTYRITIPPTDVVIWNEVSAWMHIHHRVLQDEFWQCGVHAMYFVATAVMKIERMSFGHEDSGQPTFFYAISGKKPLTLQEKFLPILSQRVSHT